MIIGDNCSINSNENANPTAGGVHTHFVVGPGGLLRIGNNVGISQAAISAYDNVVIEDNVLIGANVKIWDTDFHSVFYEDRVKGRGENSSCLYRRRGLCWSM